jgi:hypothetical protein
VDFSLLVDTDGDGDGIASTVDRNQVTAADESGFVSSDFNDTPLGGSTSGTITARGGWSVRVGDVSPGGIQTALLGAGTSPATLSVCAASGAEGVVLDVLDEMADVSCGGGTAFVRARVATPAVQLRKPLTGAGVVVDLTTGQAASLGSPVLADAGNTQAILVRFEDALGATFGSLELDPGESVDATVIGAGSVEVTVVAGITTVTVNGETATLQAGESRTFGSPRDVIDGLLARIDAFAAQRKIRNHGIALVLKLPLFQARALLARRPAAAVRALRWELVLLDLFVRCGQIAPEVRNELRPAVEALIDSLS